MTMFRYSTLGGGENAPVPSGSELIEIAGRLPVWDEITTSKEDGLQLPRASLSWHEGHGLVLHGFEALDYFLETGKQKDALNWIRTDVFTRVTEWKGGCSPI